MNNILLRSLTGAVFVSILLTPLFIQDKIWGIAAFSLFAVLGIIEFFKMFSTSKVVHLNWQSSSTFAVLIYGIIISILLNWLPTVIGLIILPILFVWMLTELWRKKEHPFVNIGVNLSSIIYIVLPFAIMSDIHQNDEHDFPLLAGMFLLIWTNDTFAFLSGKFLGKTKLFERISPKKTWEGTIGGILFTSIVAGILGYLNDDYTFWLVSSVIVAPCAIFGDLLESLFKRSLNIKDSGTILPGHGGILDRFDATLFALPFLYVWIVFYTYFCTNF